jgi:outer membrane receptor protein involved in Fe transport
MLLPAALLVASVGVFAATARAQVASDNTRRLDVTVLDEQGLAVLGAQVVATQPQGNVVRRATSASERFTLGGLAPGVYTVRVSASGFQQQEVSVDLRTQTAATAEVRLKPAGITEQLVVTATRSEQRIADVPASVSIMGSEEIQQSPAVVADDVLRMLPSFSLFRRTSSLSSHPTAQGVSLRGIGPSGTSRTLVLLDDVPFNDPFGGWVYWTRVPLMSVDRIEVIDGSTSSLYGNYAMGGVINIVTNMPAGRALELKPQYGSRTSPKIDFFASDRWNDVGVAVEGSAFNTDGYPIVAASEHGPVDNNATVDFRNVSTKVEYTPAGRMSAFLRVGYFTEDRVNGKVGEVNDTRWTTASGGVRIRMKDESTLQGRLFVDDQKFHSTFLAVTNSTTTRNVVRLATDQRVPARGVGGMVQWSKPLGSHAFSAGSDWRWVDGDSREDAYVAALPTVIVGVTQDATLSVQRVSGGTQRSLGGFLQDIFTPVPKLVVTLNARIDSWRNYGAHNLETTVATGAPTANNKPSLPDKSDTVVSPRIAAIYHVTDQVSAWGDFGYGFRAPTLNELYRQFSIGAAVTRPNDQLGPERLVGGELGVNVSPTRNVTVRTTWYDNRPKNQVSNITIGVNLAQRQNVGRTRIWGVQNDLEYRLGYFRFTAGYLYNQAKVTEFAANPAVVGKFLPQVPVHRSSLHVAYMNPRVANLAAGIQFLGRQFDEDLNVRAVPIPALEAAGYKSSTDPGLPGYAVVDFMASRAVNRTVEVFFGVQNLFDREYFVGTLPTTVGTPRLINGGIRVRVVR